MKQRGEVRNIYEAMVRLVVVRANLITILKWQIEISDCEIHIDLKP